MRKRLHPTRIKSQDMKTGEFAYMDQLIQDGYFPNLWVLPENYEPPQPVGQSSALPLMPIFNVSPPNTQDELLLPLYALTNLQTGMALIYPNSLSDVGIVRFEANALLDSVNSTSAIGTIFPAVPVTPVSNIVIGNADPNGLAFQIGPNSAVLSGAALSVSMLTVPSFIVPKTVVGIVSQIRGMIPTSYVSPNISSVLTAGRQGTCGFAIGFSVAGIASTSAFTAPTYPTGWGSLVGWGQGAWGQY